MSKIYRVLISLALLGAGLFILNQPVSATPRQQSSNCILIKQAVDDHQIQVVLNANGELFYHQPVHYQITNLTGSDIVICFPIGQKVEPADSASQTLIIIDDHPISIGAGQLVEGDLSAFCINESKHAPSKDDPYSLGDLASGQLLDLAKIIQSETAQGHIGAQMAVWAITDQTTLDDLNATSSPDQPSLIESIKPLLCLAQDEVSLGARLLQDSNTGVVLYHGDNPLTGFCQAQGIPSIGQLIQRLKILGIWAGVIVVGTALLCVILIVAVILLFIRLVRKK